MSHTLFQTIQDTYPMLMNNVRKDGYITPCFDTTNQGIMMYPLLLQSITCLLVVLCTYAAPERNGKSYK